MMKKNLITLLVVLFFAQAVFAQTTGTFTDSRDGQEYKTISFENALLGTTVTWMAQNLNYEVRGSYSFDDSLKNYEVRGSYAFDDSLKALGLLYTWKASKKACPTSWHLATDTEWSILVNEFGGTTKAGEALKSSKGWNENGNGTNSSGFSALPAGFRLPEGNFFSQGIFGYWWSSSPSDEGKAWVWGLWNGDSKVYHKDLNVSNGCSVRCVRD